MTDTTTASTAIATQAAPQHQAAPKANETKKPSAKRTSKAATQIAKAHKVRTNAAQANGKLDGNGNTKKPSVAEAFHFALIPKATGFIASVFLGRGKYAKCEAAPLAEARTEGSKLAGVHGKPAMIYAILPEGSPVAQVLVPDSYQPDRTLQPAPEAAKPTPSPAPAAAPQTKVQPSQEAFLCHCINTYGDGQHPVAKPDGLGFFVADYIATCVKRAIDSGKLAKEAIAMGRTYLDDAAKGGKANKPAKRPETKPAAAGEKRGGSMGGRRGWLEAEARAKEGKMPPCPDFSAPTHNSWRKKLDEVHAMAKRKDLKALQAYSIKPVSSSPRAIMRYRDLVITALQAQGKAA
jgi:hypothetical protein